MKWKFSITMSKILKLEYELVILFTSLSAWQEQDEQTMKKKLALCSTGMVSLKRKKAKYTLKQKM